MTIEREVLEFIIVPPFEQRAAVSTAKERFENYLAGRFPGYKFRVGPFAPVGDEDDFCVLPIMNFLGDDGRSYMCKQPRRWLLHEIGAACRQFGFQGTSGCAA